LDTLEERGSVKVTIDVVAAVIQRRESLLVTKRPPGTHLEGLWEFPGGKVKENESRQKALKREIREELDAAIEVGRLIFHISHVYEDRAVRLFFYACQLRNSPRPMLGQEMQWITRRALGSLDFLPADAELIRRLATAER
jgi:mutator protein MutT